jgi:SAM-dependent methyltransferase
MLGSVEDRIVTAFREGGGVPYSDFPTFQRVMAQQSAQVQDALLVDAVLPLVPGLRERLEQGIDAVDVGCGSGHAVNLLARAFPRSRFTGVDTSEEGLARAREEAASLGLRNATFVLQDAARLSGPPAYDLVTTFDAVHDQADPAAVLRGIHDVLRPGGTYLCVDIGAASDVAGNLDHPFAPYFYTVSTMHCMTVSLAEGGAGLGACWGQQTALRMLGEAGFDDVTVHTVEGDLANAYYVARRR